MGIKKPTSISLDENKEKLLRLMAAREGKTKSSLVASMILEKAIEVSKESTDISELLKGMESE